MSAGCSGANSEKTEASHCPIQNHSPATNDIQPNFRRNRAVSHPKPVNGVTKHLMPGRVHTCNKSRQPYPKAEPPIIITNDTLNLRSKVPKSRQANPTQQLRRSEIAGPDYLSKISNQLFSSLATQPNNRSRQIEKAWPKNTRWIHLEPFRPTPNRNSTLPLTRHCQIASQRRPEKFRIPTSETWPPEASGVCTPGGKESRSQPLRRWKTHLKCQPNRPPKRTIQPTPSENIPRNSSSSPKANRRNGGLKKNRENSKPHHRPAVDQNPPKRIKENGAQAG